MTDSELYRTLWFAPFVGAMTAFQIATDCGKLWGERGGKLAQLGMDSWQDSSKAESLRIELLHLARDSAECAHHDIGKGIDELERWAACK
jgi:hypothetical protein